VEQRAGEEPPRFTADDVKVGLEEGNIRTCKFREAQRNRGRQRMGRDGVTQNKRHDGHGIHGSVGP